MSRIFLLINDPLVAGRMRSLIDATPGLEVAGWVSTLAQARVQLAEARPELVLADLQFSDGWLADFLHELSTSVRYGRPKSLAVTLTIDDPQLLEALSHGADGYFLQGHPPPALITAIQQALAGGAEMAPAIARQVKAHFEALTWDRTDCIGEQENPLHPTTGERLLLQWIADGFLPHEIARDMRITPREVAQRVRMLYRKLQFDRRAATLSLQLA